MKARRWLALSRSPPTLNPPRILGTMTKAATRRFEAAFARLGCAVRVELGTHAPLAAAISAPDLGESETALADQLLSRLPAQSLLLGDRLYGNGAFIGRLLADAPAGTAQAFLLRVSQTPRPRLISVLADGSTLVEVRTGRDEAAASGRQTILGREVRGRVRRPGGAWSEVRLWTILALGIGQRDQRLGEQGLADFPGHGQAAWARRRIADLFAGECMEMGSQGAPRLADGVDQPQE